MINGQLFSKLYMCISTFDPAITTINNHRKHSIPTYITKQWPPPPEKPWTTLTSARILLKAPDTMGRPRLLCSLTFNTGPAYIINTKQYVLTTIMAINGCEGIMRASVPGREAFSVVCDFFCGASTQIELKRNRYGSVANLEFGAMRC